MEYFNNLFSTGQPTRMDECFESLDSRILDGMNEMLLRPFTTKEVDVALHQIAPLKVLKPDGFNACFF